VRNLFFLTINYNSSELISRLLKSIPDNVTNRYRILIINNSPEDLDLAKLNKRNLTIIEAQENLGFGKACNRGLNWIYTQDPQAIVWLINPDTYFESNRLKSSKSFVQEAIAFFTNYPQISILGTTIYNSQGVITSAGGTFTPETAALSEVYSLVELKSDYVKTDWVSGCSLLINLSNFEQCPQFDPRYFLYYEDLDFCLRYGQQGHQIAVTPRLKIIHDTSSITNRNIFKKYQHITYSYLIHIEKHGSLLVFALTNIRMFLNTVRLIVIKPKQGWGKLLGFSHYWYMRLINTNVD
jgi:GT2 family glycosyltransferase